MTPTFFKNAFFNVVRLGAGAIAALFLPPLLTRLLPLTTYGAWAVILQLSAYVNYLDFGVQTAVGRYIAHSTVSEKSGTQDQIASTALLILIVAALLGTVLIIALALQVPKLFPQMPTTLHASSQIAILILGLSLSISLPFSVFSGIFIGLQRAEIPAVVIGLSRLISALLVIVAATMTGNLVWMSFAMSLVNVGTGIVQWQIKRKKTPEILVSYKHVDRALGQEILKYCFSLTIWSIAMLLINGLDTVIVGYFDFRSVPYYAIASSFVIFISGLQNALFSALMPVAAVMGAKNDAVGLGSLLERSTRYGMFVLFASGLPMFMFAHPLLVLWVGTDYAAQSTPILQILVVANIVRLSATPYATLLIGTGQQRLTLLSPIVEGIVNVIVSVWAGSMYGSIGVAIGTLVGALVAVSINILYNLPRTKDIALTRPEYVKHGLLRPLACALPFFLMLLPISSLIARIILGVVVLLICVGLSWQLGLRESERKRILLIVNKRLQVRVV